MLLGSVVEAVAGGLALALDGLAGLLQVDLERADVVVEAERRHGEQDVLAVDRLALLLVAPLRRLRRDERDELADALLHALARVLRDLQAYTRKKEHFNQHCPRK